MSRAQTVAAVALAVLGSVAGGSAVAAAPSAPKPSSPGVEIRESDLGGQLVSALAPGGDELLLLVAPIDEVDGARRLLRVVPRAGSVPELLAGTVGGWTKSLVALELDGGAELAAAGLGRLASIGALAQPTGEERTLVDHPGFDLRSLAPERLRTGVERELVTAEIGALRIWTPRPGGGVALAHELELPFRIERERSALRLAGPPVAELPRDAAGRRRFACGPERVGGRLRVELIEQAESGDWTRTETWSALPGFESVEESWLGSVDGRPALVAHTQSATETNVFEDQLWRLFLLAPDRTRAGRAPALAMSVDSKRWHDNQALIADADGDGKSDLLIARPEGLTGSDLVVEVYRGAGGGRFERNSRRTDVDEAPSSWRLLADADGSGRPGLVTIGGGALELFRFARDGRRALERAPALRALLPASPKVEPPPGEEAPPRTRFAWLGTVPGVEGTMRFLLLGTREKAADRLLVIDGPTR